MTASTNAAGTGRPVRWPGNAYDPAGTDLSDPIKELLRSLGLLEATGEKVRAFTGTPQALQVITAGGTALSKGWAAFAGGAGSLSAAVSFFQGFREGTVDTLRGAVLIAAGTLVLATSVVAVAVIVRADVAARAQATAAEYEARARVASALMTAFQGRNPLPRPVKFWAKVNGDDDWHPVTGISRRGDLLLVHLDGGAKVSQRELTDWRAEP